MGDLLNHRLANDRLNCPQKEDRMISSGHLVQDWIGRFGIALGPCEPPASEELDDSLERVGSHWGGRTAWWRIALFSGTIVKSPEPGTDSWGPVKRKVLEWAIKRADRTIAEQLKSISLTVKNERGSV
jgi:hypothetical protein